MDADDDDDEKEREEVVILEVIKQELQDFEAKEANHMS